MEEGAFILPFRQKPGSLRECCGATVSLGHIPRPRPTQCRPLKSSDQRVFERGGTARLGRNEVCGDLRRTADGAKLSVVFVIRRSLIVGGLVPGFLMVIAPVSATRSAKSRVRTIVIHIAILHSARLLGITILFDS